MTMRVVFAVAVAGLALSAAGPGRAQEAPQRTCAMSAYVVDRDPKGVNVRATPSNQGRLVGVLPKSKEATGVSIVGETNGWFRIDGYEDFDAGKDIKLAGWIHGSRLAAGLRRIDIDAKGSERLREEPSAQAKTLFLYGWEMPANDGDLKVWAELPGGKREAIDRKRFPNAADGILLACQGGWVKIRLHRYEGWIERDRLCGNPVTTCS